MTGMAIQATNLSKLYHIGTKSQFGTLREALGSVLDAPFQVFRKDGSSASRRAGPQREAGEIWPLQDVSFEIGSGEIVGLVGRNGAGKTTLLKILSQITTPTSGEARIWGRVGALLGAGTGFHHELTGHENIFLRGAILGMNRREVTEKYRSIVEFSGIEDFLYTPVKHYSAGMLARLAFSVDVHLEPEILLLDEVFAVGDSEFRPKSMQKMTKLIRSGCTVILVNHSTEAIKNVCTRAMWLDRGRIVADGPVDEVTQLYEDTMREEPVDGKDDRLRSETFDAVDQT